MRKNPAGQDRPAVLLDLDNTILDFDMAERTALSRAFDLLGDRKSVV